MRNEKIILALLFTIGFCATYSVLVATVAR